MTKIIFNAPYLKVVEVKNDIIATSGPSTSTGEFDDESKFTAPGRNFFGEDEF